MPKLLFAYSLYHANSAHYEGFLIKIREKFSANKPDIFLNNPEYLILTPVSQDWQKEIVTLISALKQFAKVEVEGFEDSKIHIVYRFAILEMQSTLFQFPEDLEDDDDD
ncbi:hypothetical protein [Helicobacter sp.]|uniref:hypothetical protein n=1 Tax=Helicobacter sp. TaxID=218 RepID=UPI0025BA9E1E|nr:hypothetical protein [Helicobacter sp.]MCI5633553.1 hypothetical protein [Helicobacter sp.]MDY5556297.1 hypothetical protein [Helicobacter sp.]